MLDDRDRIRIAILVIVFFFLFTNTYIHNLFFSIFGWLIGYTNRFVRIEITNTLNTFGYIVLGMIFAICILLLL